MPGARLMWKSPAASAAPVEPPDTSASARPVGDRLEACTIEASGVERTASAGSGALAIETGASTTSTPPGVGPIAPAGPNSSTRTPCCGGERRTGRDLGRSEVGAVRVHGDRDRRSRAGRAAA